MFEEETEIVEVEGDETVEMVLDVDETPPETVPTKKSKSEIKKPQSNWILFCGQNRANLLKGSEDVPPMSITECLKKMGEMYKSLSDEERQTLNDLAAEDKERYRLELETCVEDDENDTPDPNKAVAQHNNLAFPMVCKI